MSIIVAVKKGDTVYMGADTQVSCDTYKTNLLCESDYKIQKMENGVLIGLTGNVKISQIILTHPEFFEIDEKKGLTRAQIVKNILPQIILAIKEKGYMGEEKLNIRGSMIIAYKDTMYYINSSCTLNKRNYYGVIGFRGVAQYQFQNFDYDGDINGQLIEIMRNAEKINNTISHPFVLINTKDLKFKVVEK